MGHIISIINHKGGVGKSITTINLGHALARQGKKVLICDLDLQCNTTQIFSTEIRKDNLSTLIDLDIMASAESCIHGTNYENLHIIPNIKRTAGIEQKLIQKPKIGLMLLRKQLREYALLNYDYTLIDNPPNLGTFVINSLAASDFCIIPNEIGSRFSLEGLKEAISFIKRIQENQNPDLKSFRVLNGNLNKKLNVHKATLQQVVNFFPKDKIFKTTIPTNTDFQIAEAKKTTIFRHRTTAPGAKAFKDLAIELINILEV